MKKTSFVLVALAVQTLLTGCAMSSGVLKMGPDTYSVSVGASPARGGVIGAKKMAYAEATQECLKADKEMLIKNEATERLNNLGAGTVDITFRCLAKGDQELEERPSYKDVPNIVIEDRR